MSVRPSICPSVDPSVRLSADLAARDLGNGGWRACVARGAGTAEAGGAVFAGAPGGHLTMRPHCERMQTAERNARHA
jgi:hypothetical protein